jgi:H(+)-translocating pyrophosphatase
MIDTNTVSIIIGSCAVIGMVYACIQALLVKSVDLQGETTNLNSKNSEGVSLVIEEGGVDQSVDLPKLLKISKLISEGANAFLFAEYRIMTAFIVLFGAVVFILVGSANTCGERAFQLADGSSCVEMTEGCGLVKTAGSCYIEGAFTTVAFVMGGITSIISGYIGMAIATYANVRCSVMCISSWTAGFNTAFRAGEVMGFSLVSLGLAVLYITLLIFNIFFPYTKANGGAEILMETIAGYGLGGSAIALFGRVGGGIYTKAADVGADLVGKVEAGIPEDDPRNPAVIADNVGDNVGDIAGMGADLFGSFAEATCAALVISSVSPQINADWGALMFPVMITAIGIIAGLITSFFATDIPGLKVTSEKHVERNLKIQLVVSTILMTPFTYLLAMNTLPSTDGGFCTHVLHVATMINGELTQCAKFTTPFQAFICVIAGLWSGLVIGFWTEFMTSYSYKPVQEIAENSNFGAGPNLIYGLSVGYKSCIVPTFALAITIYLSFSYADMYGISLAALGMLSTLCTGLSIDAYGPITDNAGGIAEMAGLPESARNRTDVLDAAGNTTAAIGKGFAIGSAALVSLALFGAFVTRVGIDGVNILQPITFSGLLIGSMLPYWFSAMTIRSVGDAAVEMVAEVRRQFKDPAIMAGTKDPDYKACITISTNASLKEMIAPGVLVMLTPILAGSIFGVHAVTGLLAGGLVSGVQMAVSASNSGGAWDNAKKLIEKSPKEGFGKGSDAHKAAVVGDTVGDPLKDTSGPALNILMKLMAIISLVFAPFFVSHSLANSMGL